MPLEFYGNNHFFSLEDILVFALFPQKYLFLVNTFLSYAKLALIGVIAYSIFRVELRSRRWAFFAALCYQLGIYAFWAVSTFDAFSLQIWFTVALYLVFTFDRRTVPVNFVLTTFVFASMVMPYHAVYGTYTLVFLTVVFTYLFLRDAKLHFSHLATYVGANLVVLLMFTVRLLPIFDVIKATFPPLRFNPFSWAFLALRLFDAEIFGFNFRSGPLIFEPISPHVGNVHLQGWMPYYFGVIAAMMVVVAVLLFDRLRSIFWLLLALFSLATLTLWSPIGWIVIALFHPLIHLLSLAMFFVFPVCMVAGATGQQIEHNPQLVTRRLISVLFGFIAFVILAGASWYAYYWWGSRHSRPPLQIVAFSLLALTLLALFARKLAPARSFYVRWWDALRRSLFTLTLVTFLSGSVVALLAFLFALTPQVLDFDVNYYADILILLGGMALISSFTLIELHVRDRSSRRKWFIAVGIASAIYLIVLFSYLPPTIFPVDGNWYAVASLAAVGMMRFTLIALIFVFAIQLLRRGLINRRSFFAILIFAQVIDLLGSFKIHSVLSMRPFLATSTIFPPAAELYQKPPSQVLDLAGYRVNKPNLFTRAPAFMMLRGNEAARASWREFGAETFQVYGVRSTGGYLIADLFNPYYKDLVSSLLGKKYGGMPPLLEDFLDLRGDRLLDLLTVRYDYHAGWNVTVDRPTALSRLMFFSDYVTLAGGEPAMDVTRDSVFYAGLADRVPPLKMLSDQSFDPWSKIVLASDPGVPASPGRAHDLDFQVLSDNEIAAESESEGPGLVLFNEGYDNGWRATVNGEPAPVLRANYAFMAVAVPAGHWTVAFEYQPESWILGRKLLLGGLGGFVVIAVALFAWPPYRRQVAWPQPASLARHLARWRSEYIGMGILIAIATAQAVFNFHNPVEERVAVESANRLPVAITASSALRPEYNVSWFLTTGTIWHSQAPAHYPEWIRLDFDQPRSIKAVKMYPQSPLVERAPGEWDLQGSSDGRDWVTLLHVNDPFRDKTQIVRSWDVADQRSFKFFRVLISKNSGSGTKEWGGPDLVSLTNIVLDQR